MYDETMVTPMRKELTDLGIEELRTPEEVEKAMSETSKGTLMVIINSVCGCAAANARPGVAKAMENSNLPDRIVTVFAGQDTEATAKIRSYIKEYPPSSPSIVFFRDGKLMDMIERRQIESRSADEIAAHIKEILDRNNVAA